MNAPASQPDLRAISLACLALAPENVRETPPSPADQAQLTASIKAHGLLENLVVRHDSAADDGTEHFAVIAGGRRLAALNLLAEDGVIASTHPVPCQVVSNDNSAELSLAENVMRIPMHPADQVVAFKALADTGSTTSAIAARFGVTERLVEQRLRLGNVARQLLNAYRADRFDLAVLQAFAITTDHEQQLAVWNQVAHQGYRVTAWQVKRMLTEDPVPANTSIARFVGVEAYESAGGTVMRDLFADQHENGVWLENRALLAELATARLRTVADELAERWKWAEAVLDADWSTTAQYGRVHPVPSEPTDEESEDMQRIEARQHELAELEEDQWTDELIEEAEVLEARYFAIEAAIEARAFFRPEDMAIAGCIATIARDGRLEVIRGLVRPDDIPAERAADDTAGPTPPAASTPAGSTPVTVPAAAPPDKAAQARKTAGVGIGLGDDLRAIRNTHVKLHLSGNFDAAFDLLLFQLVRAVFSRLYQPDALDIAFRRTDDRPFVRGNDDNFAAWNPAEAQLDDLSHLRFDWMELEDDGEAFAAMQALPDSDKQALFAAAVARTVKGQLAFEHNARPELEATIARLDIDFAAAARPTADMFWSRIPKKRALDIARTTVGPDWAFSHGKFKKPELAKAMGAAFAAGDTPLGVTPDAHAAALAWALPGFRPYDDGALPDPASDSSDQAPQESPSSDPAEPQPENPPANDQTGPDPDPSPVTTDPAQDTTGAEPNSVMAAIDAMNRVPTADGGPRVIIATVPEPAGANDDDLPEFLRNA
ncbi:MAG: ParB N-terminal domain-containing protein [Alphaproteobacteria bacterium]|nr:ParB N-terminal domain-containing protein [Alphaproteobacteria bacterium]